jgi:hypothetical protein
MIARRPDDEEGAPEAVFSRGGLDIPHLEHLDISIGSAR